MRARRAMGQNFLVSGDALHAVLDAADLHPGDRVLEVGPGVGTLTAALVQLVGCVVALELDPQLVEIVRAELAGAPNLAVVQGDALTVDHPPLVAEHCSEGPYKVVAN
ncbi:MAG: rRNA adenine N-6-methyltransferase family protein, partial [Chloroflexia bacterium]